jgi:TPR repeat protein
MLLKGQGIVQDAEEAFRWCCLAAEQGLAEAQRQLGDLYHAGHGVAPDVALADAWYEKAAKQQGEAGAAAKLGRPNETRVAGAE